MEAAPRLPMLSFDLKVCTENTKFAPELKQYIANFYNEDPDSYISEIHSLESLRASAVHPSNDVNGVQLMKKYYCQLHFLKSRFPMEEGQDAAVQFSWKDAQSGVAVCSDIRYELVILMYNIGALHTHLGANDSRSNPEGMKMACTHFQCAAWAFQTVKEKYHQFISVITSVELIHFYQQVCLAQAQECILEKSMLDNRKATIIAKVAVQVYNYYKQSLSLLQSTNDDVVGSKTYKDWMKYLQFKVAYNKCIALLFQGQQAEEQQKMGERVAFYQAASEQLEEARKLSASMKYRQQEISESLAFTLDVVEGKRKAAKNENEFIYHEEVPDKDHLEEVKGASLVKGIPFSVNDPEVSGPDIFARLVPMEAHEAASLYSEKKAQLLRQIGELVETKDQALAEFMSSMQLDILTKLNQATGLPQELIDRAASLTARPNATQDLIDAMGKLSSIYQDVESNLNEIDELLKVEEESERGYQEIMGKRPPSIIATDLAREAAKYREAHSKANDSNQSLHRAMTAHVANLKILQQPLRQLQQQLPSFELPDANVDEQAIKGLEGLVSKVDEMRTQRAMLWLQFRESVHNDDITNSLVTKQPNQSLEQLFQQELQKHQQMAGLIEQNCTAQENIKKALVDAYAQAVNTRRYVQDVTQKRNSTISALIASHDSYDDLLAKTNKGIEFYTKLETNVSKLLQRIKSTCKVQQEERDQMLSKNDMPKQGNIPTQGGGPATTAPKLKDYLDSRKKNATVTNYPDPNLQYPQVNYGMNQNIQDMKSWPPGVRPAPLGSEVTDLPKSTGQESFSYPAANVQYGYSQVQPTSSSGGYSYQTSQLQTVDQDMLNRMNSLMSTHKTDVSQYNPQQSYNNYIPQYYPATTFATQPTNSVSQSDFSINNYDPSKAYTTTTNSYRPLSSSTIPSDTKTQMQYPDSSLNNPVSSSSTTYAGTHHYSGYSQNISSQNTAYSQQPPITSQTLSYNQQNLNNYYPSSYNSTGQSSTVDGTSSKPIEYHSLEYATSVQPNQLNYSYNATYSSPVFNMSSAHARDANYMATSSAGVSASFGYPAGSAAQTYPTSDIPGSQPAYNTCSHPYSVNTAGTQQAYSGTQLYQTGVSAIYSLGEKGTQQPFSISTSSAQYYSNGATALSYPTKSDTPQTFQATAGVQQTYQGTTGIQQTYQLGATGTQQNYQINSTQQPYQVGGGTSISAQNPSTLGYGNTPGFYTANPVQNNSNYGYNVGPAISQPASQGNIVSGAPTKESNIDLLSGLDFTINQAPLIPQQNDLTKSKDNEIKPAIIENKEKVTKKSNAVKEEQPQPKKLNIKILPSKPLNNSDVKHLFKQEVDKYEKYVETLTNKTLSGPTNLDVKWKEIQDTQDCDGQKKIISVARCCPMKNRYPDILPYDYSRVELETTKNDYINASYIKDVSLYAPGFIVTQAPLPSTVGDFWHMIREQQVELIFCVASDNEIGDDVYWPKEKGQNLNVLSMVISLQSVIVKSHWVERLISVTFPENRDTWVVMHLQYTSWPGSLFPSSPQPFVSYVLELINLYQQQRCATHPVVVHCTSGIGKSGLVCLLVAAILDVTNNTNFIPDLASLTSKLTDCRKNILRDREHLKFAYEAFLSYIQEVVSQDKMNKKLNDIPKVTEENKPAGVVEKQNDDPLSTLDPFWVSKK